MPRIGLLVGVLLAAVPSAAAAQFARVSVSSAGGQANGPSETPELSGDGRLVLFASRATNLVPGDTNAVSDIFLHDRDADGDGVFDEPGAIETRRVSVLPDGTQANGDSTRPRFIGSTIVFLSRAPWRRAIPATAARSTPAAGSARWSSTPCDSAPRSTPGRTGSSRRSRSRPSPATAG